MKTPAERIASAQAAFEAGFLSMAAKKRAQDELNRAYETIREAAIDGVRAFARNEAPGTDEAAYAIRNGIFRANDLPFDLHQVRDAHIVTIRKWRGDEAGMIRDMIALRAAIKDAPLSPAPAKPEIEVKAEQVRRTIMEEMERRKALYIDGLDITRTLNEIFPRADGKIALPVSVNAHWVHGHKGARFIRHFFYLHGKLTPLNTIIAIAETLEREQETGR